jgi:hypothetical protein
MMFRERNWRSCALGLTVWAGRGSRDDMAAMAGGSTPPGAPLAAQDHKVTLMEDPDVWRPN